METTNEKIEEQLNALIRMQEDRIKVHENALQQLIDDEAVVKLLDQLIENAEAQVKELSQYVTYAGGIPETSTTFAGKLYRAWISILESFNGPDIVVGLHACIKTGEGVIETYDNILQDWQDPPLSHAVRQVLHNQKQELESDTAKLKALI